MRLVITNTLLRKYKQLFLGNPIPEAKWVLRGRIVTNNTSPLHGSGNQQYVIQEEADRVLPEATVSSAGMCLLCGQKASTGRPAASRPNVSAFLCDWLSACLGGECFEMRLVLESDRAWPPVGYPQPGDTVRVTVDDNVVQLEPLYARASRASLQI